MTVTVTESPHGLTAQATGIGIAPLHPESDTEFFIQPINARVTFEHDAAGAVRGLIFHHGDKHSHAQKIA